MMNHELAVTGVIFVGTMALANVLRAALSGEREQGTARLDARGLLLFVPIAVLFALAAPAGVLVPLTAALAVYLFLVLRDTLQLPRGLGIAFTLLAAAALYRYGVSIETVRVPFTAITYRLGWLSLPLTASWLLACGVLFGRAGTIPSVAYGVAGLAGVTFYLVCLMVPWATGPTARMLALAVAATSLAQLPAVGQVSSGSARPSSYAMGFLLGALTVVGALKHTAAIAALLPILIISAPLFGATYVYISALWGMRIGERRQHLHELLLQEGYSERQVFGVLMGLTTYMCLLGLLMVSLIPQPPWLKALVLAVGLLAGPLVCFLTLRLLVRTTSTAAAATSRAVELFNLRLHPVTMEEALARAEGFIQDGSPHMIVTSDTSAVVRAQEDEELRTIINQADLATMDGQGVVLCARLLNFPVGCRVPGVDMMEQLCAACARLKKPIALLGAQPGVAEEAARALERRYPGLRVVYTHHGYFGPAEEPEIVAAIREARPAALFVAMGIPKQEKWIKSHMDEIRVPVCMGVGGSLDVLAGHVKRAPQWMRQCGLEWLYRTAMEPRRLPRLAAFPKLLFMTLKRLFLAQPGDLPTRRADAGETKRL